MNSQEHLRFNKGKFDGLYSIDESKVTGIDVWDKVDKIVEGYAKIHPEEIKEVVANNKMIMDTRKNQMSSSDKIRWGVNIPVGLLFKLEKVEPMLFSNKQLLNKFMRKYKGFRVCEKV